MTLKDILETARVIHPYLSDLLGPEAETVSHTLTRLITEAEADEAVANQILELLAAREATRKWSRQFLQDKMPPIVNRSYTPLPGEISRIDASQFVCPEQGCLSVWYKPKTGVEPPLCPKHRKTLVPANRAL